MADNSAFFGEFLVGTGLVTATQLAEAVALQQRVNLPIGALALARGLLINVTADNVVRLLPPLTLEESEARQIVDVLGELIASRAKAP